MEIFLPFAALIAGLALGVPIAFTLAGAGALGIGLVTGDWSTVMGILGTAPYRAVADYTLTTIPMFILMAYFTSSSGVAEDLYNAAANWLSHIRGGLAIATVFAAGVFGAMSGASTAAAAVMSNIAMPNMRRFGYSEVLAAGAIAVGSTLDILIPPSVAMVVYGLVTETSIGQLLVAGVVPGILLGLLLAAVILIWVRLNPTLAPETIRVSWRQRFSSLRRVWPSLLLIMIILVLLYTGAATPSEVGAIGAFLAAVIAAVLGRLNGAKVMEAVLSTIRNSAMIFMVIIGATIFGYYMSLSQVPQRLVEAVTAMNLSPWVVVVANVIGYFVISMFMDEIPLLLLTLPLTFPLITSLGYDPVWYGVVCMMMVAMGLVFPPVGMLAFVVSASGKVDLVQVYRGTSVLIIAIVLTLILLIVFPELALWLPSTMR